MTRIVPTLAMTLLLLTPLHGRQAPASTRETVQEPAAPPSPAPDAPSPPPGDDTGRVRGRNVAPSPPPAPPAPFELRPVPTRNVKVDVTITEERGKDGPVEKVVSMVVADGRSGGVRSMTTVPLYTGPSRDLHLNVDANVSVTPANRVLVELRFSYSSVSIMTPQRPDGQPEPTSDTERAVRGPRPGFAQITETVTTLLTPGTPAVIARSADAATDRTVTVEVKADILK